MRTVHVFTILIAATAVVLATAPAAASAPDGWTDRSPIAPRSQLSTLRDVSCVRADLCFGVSQAGADVGSLPGGVDYVGGLAGPRIESWDGTAWADVASFTVPGSQSVRLEGISCVAATSCMVVGDEVDATGVVQPIAARLADGTWQLAVLGRPAKAIDLELTSVSCTDTDACTAVGHWTGGLSSLHPLIESWDGTSWTVVPSPVPPNSTSAGLARVSCTSATRCQAVGRYVTGSGRQRALSQRWDGTAWTVSTTPLPSGTVASQLDGVSCSSDDACIEVGRTSGADGVPAVLAARWDGTTWTSTAVPVDAPGAAYLSAVSCPAADDCMATGQATNAGGHLVGLAEHWDGAAWTQLTTPTIKGKHDVRAQTSLSAVSCVAGGECMAIGPDVYVYVKGDGDTLAELWDGTRWTVTPTVQGLTEAGFSMNAVSCASARSCMAVSGTASTAYSSVGMVAQHWDGAHWVLSILPLPGGSYAATVTAVSCPSTSFCVATGTYYGRRDADGHYVSTPLYESWDGAAWSVMPADVMSANGYGVSCTSPTACVAVGTNFLIGPGSFAFAEVWDGTSWTLTTNPSPDNAAALDDVSCVSAYDCTAVGQSLILVKHKVTVPSLAEHWDGSTWTIETAVDQDVLTAVSCPSATQCVALSDGGHDQSWDGTTWTAAADPPDGTDAISCAGPDDCTAVGAVGQPDPQPGLVTSGRWDGTSWTSSSEPEGGSRNAVSCVASGFCMTVGGSRAQTAG